MRESVSIDQIQRLHWRLLGVTAGLAGVTTALSPWSILVGGAVMGANVWVLRSLVQCVVGSQARRVGPVMVLGLLKQLVFLGLLGTLLWHADLDAVGLAVGVSLLAVACAASALWAQLRAA